MLLMLFLTGRSYGTLPFSLNIKKHKIFEEVLVLLENTGSVHFEIKGNTVVVK